MLKEDFEKYGVYAAIGVAGLLSLIIIGLQCQIIYLQRVLVRKGIVGKSSRRSQQGQSSTPNSVQHDESSDPQGNTTIEMTNLVPETSDNITSYNVSNGDTSHDRDFEESTTPGYDTVKKTVISSSSKPSKGGDANVKKQPTKNATALMYEDIEFQSDNISTSNGPVSRTGEDVNTIENDKKVSSHARVKIGYEHVDEVQSSNQKASNRFQIKGGTPTDKQQGKKGVGKDSSDDPLPLYSVVSKPKKKSSAGKMSISDESKDSASTLPTYSVVKKPQKKISSNGSAKSAYTFEPSPKHPTINILGDTEGNPNAEPASMYAAIPDSSSEIVGHSTIDIDDENNPYKNVASLDPLQQPLYSNCKEIEEIIDPDLGDVSSREPAPPPIPIRTYSAGWSEFNTVKLNAADSDSTGKSCSPDGVE